MIIYYRGLYKLLIDDTAHDVVVTDISVNAKTGITLVNVLLLNEFMITHTFDSKDFISRLVNDD